MKPVFALQESTLPFNGDRLVQKYSNVQLFFSFYSDSESLVNFLHNLFSPLNAGRDQLVRPWASLRTSAQVVRRPHMQVRQNRSHHPPIVRSTFVHPAASYTFRLVFATRFARLISRALNLSMSRQSGYRVRRWTTGRRKAG